MKLLVPFLRQLVWFGLVLALLTPFAYSNSTTFPFVFPKFIAFRVLVELLVPIWLALVLFDPSSRPRKSQVLTALGLWTVALFASLAFGVDAYRSFWGNHERMSGLFSILHFYALAPIAATALRTDRHWMRFWLWSLIAANVMAAIGFAQYFSENNFLLTRGGGRIWATLGNYIYLAQYSLFFSLIGFMLFFLAPTANQRWFAFGTGIIQFIILLLTETRGALLGFIAAAAFLILWFWFRLDVGAKKRRVVNLAVAGGFIVVLLFFFFGQNFSVAQKIPGLRRLTFHEFTTSAGGTSTRLIAWNIALESWRARPIFGWGIDNFHYAFNRFYHPESLKFSYYETWFDRAHNGHLDVLAMTGIFGVAAALYLYFAVARTLWKSASRDRRANIRAAFGLAIFGSYLAQYAFVFDAFNSFLTTALLYGWVMRIGWGDAPEPETEPAPVLNGALRGFAVGISGIAALILIFSTNVEPARANNLGLQASAIIHLRKDLVTGMAIYQKAFAISSPHQRDLHMDFARDVSETFNAQTAVPEEMIPVWRAAVAAIEENISRYAPDAYEHLLLSMIYAQGLNADPQALEKSMAILKKGIPLSPKRQQMYFTLGKTLLLAHQNEEAVEVLKTALAFDESVGESHWYYALALSDAGRRTEAYEELKQAFAHNYQWKTELEMLFASDMARSQNDFMNAYRYLSFASTTYGNIPEYLARLSELAAAAGDSGTARIAAEKAVSLDPSFRERVKAWLR